jgi:VanZ family protein
MFKVKEFIFLPKFDLFHYSVSFGLYYTFYTYTTSILLSIVLSILVGVLYEVYQGYSKHHSGYSHTDIFYNTIGVFSAALIHYVYLVLLHYNIYLR